MRVNDQISICSDGKKRARSPGDLDCIVLHRISFSGDDGGGGAWPGVTPIPDQSLTGAIMAGRFIDTRRRDKARHWSDRPGSYTGGEMPYTFLVRRDGQIDQCLPVSEIGPHARKWNRPGAGLAIAGDFRKEAPTEEQVLSVSNFCAIWAAWGCSIRSHDELDGGSEDKNKACPGALFPADSVKQFAQDVGGRMTSEIADWILTDVLGVIF